MAGDGPEPVPAGVILTPPAHRVVAAQPAERGVRDAGDVGVGIGDVGVGRAEVPVGRRPASRGRHRVSRRPCEHERTHAACDVPRSSARGPGRAGHGRTLLLEKSFGYERTRAPTTPHRPPSEPLDDTEPTPPPRRFPPVVLAVDIGGTKFATGLVTPRGELLDRAVVPVDPDVGPEAHFKALTAILEQQLDAADRHEVRVACVGIGSAGPITAQLRDDLARSTSRRGASSRCASGWPELVGQPGLRRPRRQGARARRRAGRDRRRGPTTTACSPCRPASAAASCSTASCSTGRRRTPATSVI